MRRTSLKSQPLHRVTITIPENLWLKIKILVCNPRTGELQYGIVSNLISSLLAEWIQKKGLLNDTKPTTIHKSSRPAK